MVFYLLINLLMSRHLICHDMAWNPVVFTFSESGLFLFKLDNSNPDICVERLLRPQYHSWRDYLRCSCESKGTDQRHQLRPRMGAAELQCSAHQNTACPGLPRIYRPLQ
jgi:hypothetical protein